jgi:hypothetical protein
MAGVKGRSGGARPGAGRKPKQPTPTKHNDPLDFLRAVWKGELQASPNQVKAASAALPFIHPRQGEGGKKNKRQAEAEKVASRFAPAAPPRLVVKNGKKV